MALRRFNVVTDELDQAYDRPGHEFRSARHVLARLGLRRLGASVFDLAAGEATFPYHYHHGVEEWLYVIAGEPLVRVPEGERRLNAGDIIAFPAGPAGAHTVRGPGRFVIFSGFTPTEQGVAASGYPDSDKIGLRPAAHPDDRLDFRRGDAVDYWEGE